MKSTERKTKTEEEERGAGILTFLHKMPNHFYSNRFDDNLDFKKITSIYGRHINFIRVLITRGGEYRASQARPR